MSEVEAIRAAALQGVTHGFLGRRGGVSTGIHAGLNVGLGSDDDRDAVLRNRDLARDAVLPGSVLVTVNQVHSADVVTVQAPIAVAAAVCGVAVNVLGSQGGTTPACTATSTSGALNQIVLRQIKGHTNG